MALRVGCIGIGLAGSSLAANVAKNGFTVSVRDANKERENDFVKRYGSLGVKVAEEGPTGFSDVDILITMVPSGVEVREILLGKDALAPHLKKDPFGTQQLAADLKEHEIRIIDCPATQVRMRGIEEGEATFMIGGDQEDIDYAMPVLRAMSRWRFVMGPVGAGHIMKTFSNYITAAGIAALNDCLVMGTKMGLDPAKMTDVLNVGTGRNYGSSHSIRAEGLTRKYGCGFLLALMVKDLDINLRLMQHMQWDTRLAENVYNLWAESLKHPGVQQDADKTEILKYWESRAGVQMPTYTDLKECNEPRDFETP